MAFLWLIALFVCIVAFVVSGEVPFTVPISLLGDDSHQMAYHVVLMGFMLPVFPFVHDRWLARDLCGLGLIVAIGVMLMVLQVVPNGAAHHDGLACSLMVFVCALSLVIAQRQGHTWLSVLAIGSFLACSLLFAEQMWLMGLAEGVVLVTGVLAMNAERLAPQVRDLNWQWPTASATRMVRWWRPGMGAGLIWGLFCVLVSSVSGMYHGGVGIIAGPAVALACGVVGYVAWQDDMSFWLRAPMVVGSYALVIAGLSAAHCVRLQVDTVIPALSLMFFIVLTMFQIDLHSP